MNIDNGERDLAIKNYKKSLAIETGKYADLIAVEGDPLADISVLQHVEFVMKGGAIVKDNLSH